MSSTDLSPLPPYTWPNPPETQGGSIPPELVEQYKAELAAHNEFIKQQLGEAKAPAELQRSIILLERQAQLSSDAAATLTEANRQDATNLAQVNANAEAVQAEFQKQATILDATVASNAADAASELALVTVRNNFLNSSVVEIHKAYIEVAKGGIDRMQKRAELLQAAAVAVGTLYTGLLAFFYITADKISKDNVALVQTLPARGIIPAVFLGGTVVFTMAYLAFRTVPGSGVQVDNEEEPLDYIEQQRNLFVDWVNHIAWWRVALIQLAVISLGGAVATLPLAFTEVTDDEAVEFVRNGVIGAILLWSVGWIVYWKRGRGRTEVTSSS